MPLPQKRLIPGILLALMLAAFAAPPLWWSMGNPPVIDPAAAVNNKGSANIGQAKHMVKSALDALRPVLPAVASQIEADLTGGTNPILSFTIPDPKTPEWIEKQKALLLIGQLKAIADPFYTRLHAAAPTWLTAERTANATNHPNSIFPWTAETTDDANKAIANIGQLKAVFSLRYDTLPTSSLDTDGDGLPDSWEITQGLNPFNSADASLPFRGGTQTNLQAYLAGITTPPNITPTNKDGDSAEDDVDADPNDYVIDWAPAAEVSYAIIEMEQVDFAEYPYPIHYIPLDYLTQIRTSIGKDGTILWQYPVKSNNPTGAWDLRYRVWKNGAWINDITNQSTNFTSFSMTRTFDCQIDSESPLVLVPITAIVDCEESAPQAVCGDFILGLGEYYTHVSPPADSGGNTYIGAGYVATLWTVGAESITGNAIDPPSSYESMPNNYFGGSAPLMGVMNYRAVASPGGACAILGTQTTAGVGLWKIWNSPDNGGPAVPGQGSPTVIHAGAWPLNDLLLITAIEDGGVAVGERYSGSGIAVLPHQVANDHGTESVFPGSEGHTRMALF